jgi:NAD(P)-dependent dehydrogenase (short-subunit alcohol dehydrogenase family)
MGIAVVTGANSGIGRATAVRLARDGHTTYGTMRDLGKGAKLQARADDAGVEVRQLALDVSDDASVATAFAAIRDEAGPVDILVNNAGVAPPGTLEETSIEDYAAVLDTNVLGLVRCSQAVLADMRERRSGCIVNVGSVTGKFAQAANAAYTTSKFAVEGLSEVLAQEVAPFGIRVVLVEPGVIHTAIFAKAPPSPVGSPYSMHHDRVVAFYAAALADPTDATVAADRISEAISSNEPRFRYRVGDDAELLLDRRAVVSDEEYIALSALETPAYLTAFSETFGFDITGVSG